MMFEIHVDLQLHTHAESLITLFSFAEFIKLANNASDIDSLAYCYTHAPPRAPVAAAAIHHPQQRMRPDNDHS